MLQIHKFEVNPFGENTYIVWDDATGRGVITDPGMTAEREFDCIDRFLTDNNITLTEIINTHLHLDHIFGVNAVKSRYGIKLAAHPGDRQIAENLAAQIERFHLPYKAGSVTIDRELTDGASVGIGAYSLSVMTTPGHTPGGLVFYSSEGRFVLTGDSLFRGSIGRTDLPGGSHSQLVSSIQQRLMSLPDDTVVYPGHGPATTIGTERVYNPYC